MQQRKTELLAILSVDNKPIKYIRASKLDFPGCLFYLFFFNQKKKQKSESIFLFFIFFNKYYKKYVQTKLFTVYLMIFGDCDNNFVFILQYTIYAYYFYFFQVIN